MGDAVLVGLEARIVGQLGLAQHLRQLAELPVIAGADHDVAALGREVGVGRQVAVAVAVELGLQPGHEVVGRVRLVQRHGAVVERGVDELALARAVALVERHQDSHAGIHAGRQVDHRHADAHRPRLGRAVDRDQAGRGLHHGVVAREAAQRAVGAEARDAGMDQARELLRQRLVADAPFLHGAGLEILDQHVGRLEQFQQDLAAFLLGEVERHRALVAVDAGEVGGDAFLVERRAPQPGLVALRRLDLDHLGAVIGQHLGAVRPAQHTRQIDDFQAFQCPRHLVPLLGHACEPAL